MSNNPGTVMASAVDSQMSQFRELQGELATLRGDLGTVLGQETENELVLLELDELTDESKVYKLLGPVLLPQDLSEAQQTVKKRLEFIRSEKERLERKVADTEVRGNALASKIQQLQAGLQQTTADAVRAIAQEHGGAVGGA
jgi:prefoldin beta subunit